MAIIEVKDLYKTFSDGQKEVQVLKALNLYIDKGELLYIFGASGVGKSTLLHIMGALDRPTKGEVIHDGTDIFSLGNKALASFRNRRIGFVFQFYHLLHEFSALENIMMPGLISGLPKKTAEKEAMAVLEQLGLKDRAKHRPGELSGGEQQRVALARAIILSPDVILADEPTGNLDSKTGEDVMKHLTELNQEFGITMVIVTHNPKVTEDSARKVFLKDGKIEET